MRTATKHKRGFETGFVGFKDAQDDRRNNPENLNIWKILMQKT